MLSENQANMLQAIRNHCSQLTVEINHLRYHLDKLEAKINLTTTDADIATSSQSVLAGSIVQPHHSGTVLSNCFDFLNRYHRFIGLSIIGLGLGLFFYPHWQRKRISLKGKTILVTGANSDAGVLLVDQLIKDGAIVYICDSTQRHLQQYINHPQVGISSIDVSSRTEIAKLVQVMSKELWAVVAIRPVLISHHMDQLQDDNFIDTLHTSCASTLYLLSEFHSILRNNGGRFIITEYKNDAASAALNQLTQALQQDHKQFGTEVIAAKLEQAVMTPEKIAQCYYDALTSAN